MRNIKLTIEYDGSNYCGWQIQSNGLTVQEVIAKAVSKMTEEKITLTGASRTDSGVHALGQVANFITSSKIHPEGFLKGLNALLPEDISIVSVEEMPLSFHSKRSSKGKQYRYLVAFGKPKQAMLCGRVWHLKSVSFDKGFVAKFNKLARPLVGEHDFSSFCGAGDTNNSKVRKIEKIKAFVIKKGNPFGPFYGDVVAIDVFGNGFLRYMVRNVIGTLIDHSIKNSSPKNIREILLSKNRKKAGTCAPAFGLYLVKVKY